MEVGGRGGSGALSLCAWHPSLPPPAAPILPILSVGASSPGPAGSAFSSGRSGQSRSGLLLLGGGRGCFWRRMYSTEGEGGL